MMFPKHKRIRDRAWLDKVRDYPCLVTGATPCEPAHVRVGLGGGMGLKPDDNRVVPLVHELHARQHQIGELRFWQEQARENPHFLIKLILYWAEKEYDNR